MGEALGRGFEKLADALQPKAQAPTLHTAEARSLSAIEVNWASLTGGSCLERLDLARAARLRR